MSKVLCPRHEDTNPSCEVYPDHGYCFVCATSIPIEELGLKRDPESQTTQEPEDVGEVISYILSLPLKVHRSLVFPCDEKGYYIVWPFEQYYKYRLFSPTESQPKYIGPRGVKPPLFYASLKNSQQAILVEGEINALSIANVFFQHDVLSLGSAGHFNAKNLEKYLTVFGSYNSLIVILDKDKAGTEALMRTKGYLLYKLPFVTYIQLEPDANDILCQEGPDGLREAVLRELQRGM